MCLPLRNKSNAAQEADIYPLSLSQQQHSTYPNPIIWKWSFSTTYLIQMAHRIPKPIFLLSLDVFTTKEQVKRRPGSRDMVVYSCIMRLLLVTAHLRNYFALNVEEYWICMQVINICLAWSFSQLLISARKILLLFHLVRITLMSK